MINEMQNLPALVVDNFFDDVDNIRLHALAQRTYEPCDFYTPGIFSGYRSPINNSDLTKYIHVKIESILSRKIMDLRLSFHLNTDSSVCGCPHQDITNHDAHASGFAGVIYLTPHAPKNSGTTIYRKTNVLINEPENYMDKMQIVYDIALPPTNMFKQKFAQEMRDYKNTLEIVQQSDHIYNRMILYPSVIYHSPDEYFGTNLDNGRLTISIHGNFE